MLPKTARLTLEWSDALLRPPPPMNVVPRTFARRGAATLEQTLGPNARAKLGLSLQRRPTGAHCCAAALGWGLDTGGSTCCLPHPSLFNRTTAGHLNDVSHDSKAHLNIARQPVEWGKISRQCSLLGHCQRLFHVECLYEAIALPFLILTLIRSTYHFHVPWKSHGSVAQ